MNSRGPAAPGLVTAPLRTRPWARRAVPLALVFIVSLALGRHAQGTPPESGLMAEAARLLDPGSFRPARLSLAAPEPSCFPRFPAIKSFTGGECKGWTSGRASGRRLNGLARRARAGVGGASAAEALHVLALVDIAFSDSGGKSLSRSISSLQQASRLSARAPLLTDLAAAYLLRAERLQRTRDLMDALEAATEAVRLDSASAAARFNLALALDRTGLDARAAAAWKGYLALDSVSAWAGEARARLGVLAPRPAPLPPASPRDTSAVAHFAVEHPQEAQLLGWDRVLGEWGAAVMEGDSARARERLELAWRLGVGLAVNGRDATLMDQVHVIRKASRNPRLLRRQAGAHREYAAARAAYLASRHDAAGEGFARVLAASQPGSPLHQWATVFYGAAEGYRDPRRGEPILRRGVARADSLRHPALAGRGRWLLATSLLRQARYREARDEYGGAARHFRRAGEREHLGAVQAYAGTAEHHLENGAAAYASFHAALMSLRPYRGSRWLHSAVWGLANAAAEDGYLHATVHVLDEDVEVTRLARNPIDAAEVLTTRARLMVAAGSADQAVAALDAGLAADALNRVESGQAR
ncbi:MAG TPA: hypothetical protein VIB55_16485, partial [Longimicrobium sp.]